MLIFDGTPTGRNRLFWTLQTTSWATYWLIRHFSVMFWDKPVGTQKLIAVIALSGFVITALFRPIYRRLWGRSPTTIVLGALAVCYGGAVVWTLIIGQVADYWSLFETSDSSLIGLLLHAFNGIFELLTWTGLYFGYRYYESSRDEHERTLKASALAQEAQVKMLRYQLNPHFLFNTLNAISTLILENQNRVANQAVTRLSEFLRYTLDQDPMKKVTLRQEIDALNLYLSTERLRFGERLTIEFAVEEAALSALLPSLLLQPLIENAVKYAVAPREDGGRIRVEGRIRSGMLEIAVEDDGPGLAATAQPGNGRGVGLRNTRERLAVVYADRHRFATLNAQPGLRIEIAIPEEREA
jgi:two-component system LytT family sensor kinase